MSFYRVIMRQAEWKRFRRLFSWAACALVVAGSVGCARWFSGDHRGATIVVASTMDKSTYRPGETVVVDVRIQNVTDRPIKTRRLDASSVSLAYNRVSDAETPVYREPTHSETAQLGRMTQLGPGQYLIDRFVFTRLTQYSGAMKGVVKYDPNPPGSFVNGVATYGNVMHFSVSGQKLFDRDNAGLISNEDAIRLAKSQEAGPFRDAKAIVVQDRQTGLYATWVNLTIGTPRGTTVASYIVDPYEGRVLGRAKPFNPAAAEDPRFRRPANLPPMRARAGVSGDDQAEGAPATASTTGQATPATKAGDR